jgi:hypothetical protein
VFIRFFLGTIRVKSLGVRVQMLVLKHVITVSAKIDVGLW